MIVSCVEAVVSDERSDDMRGAWARVLREPLPDGLIESRLLRAHDGDDWRIETVWRNTEAIAAMRATGVKPAAIAMFEAAGANPALTVWDVEGTLEA
jgi:hypothetical protein